MHTNEQVILSSIDSFCIFKRSIAITGWAFCSNSPISKLTLRFPSGKTYPLDIPALQSADVALVHGTAASNCRFDEQILVYEPHESILKAELIVTASNGITLVLSIASRPHSANTHWVTEKFLQMLGTSKSGNLLEVGSRARSGIVRKGITPREWTYTGLDVMAGDNVDILGDAHDLSNIFKHKKFDAVAAFSVLEHLLMPWKFVVELNKILNVGSIGLFTTHQAWPLHDAPWDFWRFSDKAWAALFNKSTGFEIITTAMGEPAYTVALNCHPATDFREQHSYLSSVVLFRKVAETALDWPVDLKDILASQYPPGQVNLVSAI
jgi:hypothetical protein